MSRIYRPRDNATAHMPAELPSADLLREVRDIERRRVLIDLRDAVDRISTSERDGYSGYGSRDRSIRDFKADVLAALRSAEVDR